MPSSPPDSREATPTTGPGDRYDLGEVIGRGGMAEVFRAHDRLLGRDVAVKVLRDDVAPDTRGRERFTSEARLLAGLSHANLVTVWDAGFTGDRPYLVMELVEGRTLAQVVAEAPLDPAAAGVAGAQLADALAYAHGRGVVHRDVKPANVLVEAGGRVRLADFGIARLVDDATGHTRTGTTIGTAAYLAPEQVTGEAVTGAADVYALGLVLLESLTGVRPFPGTTAESALARLHRSPDVPASLPVDLRDLLARMTAREPDRRPSAAEVAQRLRSPSPCPPATGTGDDATRVLTQVVPAPTPAATTPPPAPAERARALVARARTGVDPARAAAADLLRRVRALPHDTQVVLGVVAALVLLLVLVAVLGGGDAAGGSGGGDPVPPETPRHLRQPLQDLHDAVNGS